MRDTVTAVIFIFEKNILNSWSGNFLCLTSFIRCRNHKYTWLYLY